MSASTADEVSRQIQSSDQFNRFVEEIAEHFHEDDYKDDRIPDIKTSFRETAEEAGLASGEAQGVAGRLIGSLMQEAGQKAPPPPDVGEPDLPPYHPEELFDASDQATTTWSLLDVVRAPVKVLEEDTEEAVPILKDGVQRALIVLVCVYAADATRNEVPPRFTSQFQKAMVNPSPGGLMNFLNWAASRSFSTAVHPLNAYIDDVEKSGDEWFSRLATLRNRWAHPDEYDVETTLEETREMLEEPPSFVTASTLAVFENGAVHWTGTEDDPFSLTPFLRHQGSDLYVPEEMEPPDSLQFPTQTVDQKNAFPEVWHRLRVADRKLENPTPSEFRAKLKLVAPSPSPDDPSTDPGELTSFAWQDAPGLLAVPSLASTARTALQREWSRICVLSYSLEDNQSLLDPLPDILGLRQSPSWEDLCSFQYTETPTLFVADTTKQNSSDFLQRLYELADFHDACVPSHLKFVLCRPEEKVKADQEMIWDRLPSHLSDLLYPPSSNPALKLPAHLWTPDRRFPWHKRLLIRIQDLVPSS